MATRFFWQRFIVGSHDKEKKKVSVFDAGKNLLPLSDKLLDTKMRAAVASFRKTKDESDDSLNAFFELPETTRFETLRSLSFRDPHRVDASNIAILAVFTSKFFTAKPPGTSTKPQSLPDLYTTKEFELMCADVLNFFSELYEWSLMIPTISVYRSRILFFLGVSASCLELLMLSITKNLVDEAGGVDSKANLSSVKPSVLDKLKDFPNTISKAAKSFQNTVSKSTNIFGNKGASTKVYGKRHADAVTNFGYEAPDDSERSVVNRLSVFVEPLRKLANASFVSANDFYLCNGSATWLRAKDYTWNPKNKTTSRMILSDVQVLATLYPSSFTAAVTLATNYQEQIESVKHVDSALDIKVVPKNRFEDVNSTSRRERETLHYLENESENYVGVHPYRSPETRAFFGSAHRVDADGVWVLNLQENIDLQRLIFGDNLSVDQGRVLQKYCSNPVDFFNWFEDACVKKMEPGYVEAFLVLGSKKNGKYPV